MYKDITIGYLSWKKHDVFRETLKSHRENGLFDAIPPKNRLIIFQEISNEDIKIAEEFKCKYTGNSSNIGILNAFIQMVKKCETEYFIFCENDFILMENSDLNIKKTLDDVISILKENENSKVKLSNSKNPGFLYATPNNKNEWLSKN